MARFATATKTPKTKAPAIKSVAAKGIVKTKKNQPAGVTTFEGAKGYARKPKSELFLLGVTNMVTQDTFYESGKVRDARFLSLIHEVTAEDPKWVASFIPYLRDTLNMRTASIVAAAEYVKAGGPNGRSVVSGALLRADEPSELLAYWIQNYGKRIPQPIKRGIADAAIRLYNERSQIKWDTDTLVPRFGDVIELTHPKAATPWQHDLFRYALDKRHNREDLARNTESLSTIRAYRDLMSVPVLERRALVKEAVKNKDFVRFENAGLTWENLSGWLQGPMDAEAWESIIPQMGYMALLRNLRNFDDAKISLDSRAFVIEKLTNPDEVAKSRQLPLRFLSAYKNVEGAHWIPALETAVDLVLANVPSLPGKTLVLVDVSGSMDSALNTNSHRNFKSGTAKYPLRWEAAALFGAAVAVRAEKADLIAFESNTHVMDFRHGGSILKTVSRFSGVPHGGTETHKAIAERYKDHDRVVIVTDEQATYWGQSSGAYSPSFGYQRPGADLGARVDAIKAPFYIFNVAGYANAMMESKNGRYTFGGLTDHGFKAITALENFQDETWPWEVAE